VIYLPKRKLGKGSYVEENTFGAKLRSARIEANITQQELAEALGVTKSVISNWERSFYKPRNTHRFALLQLFPELCE
jgi:transcriptional regulator with XRE-family HTH domain